MGLLRFRTAGVTIKHGLFPAGIKEDHADLFANLSLFARGTILIIIILETFGAGWGILAPETGFTVLRFLGLDAFGAFIFALVAA